jgi:hypothetical protein
VSQDEWDNLQPGMIVVERRSKTPRLVLNVRRRPWRCKPRVSTSPEHVSIDLFKLRGSRSCPTTSLTPSDWRHRLDVAHGKTGIVVPEFFYCDMHGWSHITGGPVWMKGWDWPPAPDWSTMPWVRL